MRMHANLATYQLINIGECLTLYQPMTHNIICVMSHKNLYGDLILDVNPLYRLFCFVKLFPMVGKGLNLVI